MLKLTRVTVLSALLVAGLFTSIASADWPGYNGPNGDSMAPSSPKLARSWPEAGPKTLWSATLGQGFGAPSIHNGEVFLLDRVGETGDKLRVWDLQTGKEKWSVEYSAPGKVSFEGSRSTPAANADSVFTVGAFGQVHAFDRKSQSIRWKVSLIDDFGGRVPHWGVAQSPLIVGNNVVVAPQSSQAALIALDGKTGKVVWKSEPVGPMSYASPVLTTINGKQQILCVVGESARTKLLSVDPADGKTLWSYTGWQCKIPIPNATALGDGRFFLTGGYNAGSAMIKVTPAGSAYNVEEVFRLKAWGAQVHEPIYFNGNLFAVFNSNELNEGLVCLDPADGKLLWQTSKAPGFDRGGHLIADGLLILQDARSGHLRLVEPHPAEYKELASAKITTNPKQAWANLAFSNGLLLVRDQERIRCVDLRP